VLWIRRGIEALDELELLGGKKIMLPFYDNNAIYTLLLELLGKILRLSG
jgi:hypothetical protein